MNKTQNKKFTKHYALLLQSILYIGVGRTMFSSHLLVFVIVVIKSLARATLRVESIFFSKSKNKKVKALLMFFLAEKI
jgi:hypothetical protein